MSANRFVAVTDAIDWCIAAQREAQEKQRRQFSFSGLARSAGASGDDEEFDWSISPLRAGYAAFLASLKASGFVLVPLPPTPREAE